MNKPLLSSLICLVTFSVGSQNKELPEGFVYVEKLIPDIIVEMRYADSHNFIGRPIPGYKKPKAILAKTAAEALAKVQNELQNKGLCLKIFDAYRPQKAVDYFIEWARDPTDTIRKQEFYPEVDKHNLFSFGYISTRSGHSRGSTLDLTIIDANTGEELDMGGSYDFFGDISHHNASSITSEQKDNRQLLKSTMQKYGFVPYSQEWWHYTYKPETFPEKYFDFEVE